MFKETLYDDIIKTMLEEFSIEDLLEMMDITPEQVLEILLEGSHVEVPPFFQRSLNEEDEDS